MRKSYLNNMATWSLVALLGLSATTLTGCVKEKEVSAVNKTFLTEPVLDKTLAKEDFAFPSRPPRLSKGQVVFNQNCAVCHKSVSYTQVKNRRPIDMYLTLTRGDNGHPVFTKLTRDQRWEAVFYAYYLSGGAKIGNPQVASIFGANCAVCHGAKGFADGPLHTGHASAHELGMAAIKNDFDPPPANFHSYSRMYNRTDDILVKHILEGVYPSAMPSWEGRVDQSKGIVFNEPLVRDLVKYIRQFAYENDLPAEQASAPSPAAKELSYLAPGMKATGDQSQ